MLALILAATPATTEAKNYVYWGWREFWLMALSQATCLE